MKQNTHTPIIFLKSAKRLALEKLAMLLVAVLVGALFGSLFFIVDSPRWPVKIAAALAVIVSIFMVQKILREAIQILRNGEDWRVEITDTTLAWHSPVPEQMQSFDIEISRIKSTHFTLTRYKNSKRNAKKEYHIDITNGDTLKLNPQLCGINPHSVFKALEKQGVNFQVNHQEKGANLNIAS